MENEVRVILDLSDEVQTFLEAQGIDFYQELQQEMPELKVERQSDPEAPEGSKDVVMVILAVSTLVSSITPLIIRILNQYTPPNRSENWEVDEKETRPDGSIVERKYVRSSDEQRPWAALPYPNTPPAITASNPNQPPKAQ